MFWNHAAPDHVAMILECAAKISTPAPTWASPEVVPTELGGGRRLPDAAAPAPRSNSASKNVAARRRCAGPEAE
jgi:hypothetical protein